MIEIDREKVLRRNVEKNFERKVKRTWNGEEGTECKIRRENKEFVKFLLYRFQIAKEDIKIERKMNGIGS